MMVIGDVAAPLSATGEDGPPDMTLRVVFAVMAGPYAFASVRVKDVMETG